MGANMMPIAKKSGRTVLGVRMGLQPSEYHSHRGIKQPKHTAKP